MLIRCCCLAGTVVCLTCNQRSQNYDQFYRVYIENDPNQIDKPEASKEEMDEALEALRHAEESDEDKIRKIVKEELSKK